MIELRTPAEIEQMRPAGRFVAEVLATLRDETKVGTNLLAIDRRALLVSSLAYVLWALYSLFTRAGAVELGGALTALVIGSALLTLSAFWQPMRRRVVGMLGGVAERLPPVQLGAIPRSA